MKKTITIGGVPEHFNYPWHLASEQGLFEKEEINLVWKDYPNGTGAMCTDLRNGTLDIAVLLTEGIIADISKGNPSSIIQPYVNSPLLWGIHVPAGSSISKPQDLQGKTIAISRYGSGSHLMAFVDARIRGWDTSALKFEVVENMEGARKAFRDGNAEVFFWEKFMTKPLVTAGEFRLADVRPTPWPCFHIAARNEFIASNGIDIKNISSVILNTTKKVKSETEQTVIEISKRYKLEIEDVREWLSLTEWASEPVAKEAVIENVSEVLFSLKIIPEIFSAQKICSDIAQQ